MQWAQAFVLAALTTSCQRGPPSPRERRSARSWASAMAPGRPPSQSTPGCHRVCSRAAGAPGGSAIAACDSGLYPHGSCAAESAAVRSAGDGCQARTSARVQAVRDAAKGWGMVGSRGIRRRPGRRTSKRCISGRVTWGTASSRQPIPHHGRGATRGSHPPSAARRPPAGSPPHRSR